MSKVLVVDDEPGYCDVLALHLSQEGHDVKTVGTGREAIDLGMHYRPQVLVADWLLKDHIHGLHVADVLRVVDPRLRIILITGFSSQDLQAEADRVGVSAFIEKPFDLDDILSAVHDAATTEYPQRPGLPVALVQVDTAGIIDYANAHARALFARTSGGMHASHIEDILGRDTCARLDEAIEQWLEVVPHAPEPLRWLLRTRTNPETTSRLLLMLSEDAQHFTNAPLTCMLLDLPASTRLRWSLQGPALVIDDTEVYRHLTRYQLELVGGICHTVGTHDEGLHLFQSDPTISVVILAENGRVMPRRIISQFVSTLKAIRPEVPIVGCSARDYREAFAALGVLHFLLKPWRGEDLINLLT